MIAALILLVASSLLASGILIRHARVLTYIAMAAALGQAQWLSLTLLDRTILANVDTTVVFTTGAILSFALAVAYRRQFHPPYTQSGSGWRDITIIAVLLFPLLAAWFVSNVNGYHQQTWIMHGFYNGDTTTFISLVQKSLLTDRLVDSNPFAGNGPLEYPTLLHAGVATAIASAGLGFEWLHFLPTITFSQLVITIPLFFLIWDLVLRPPDVPRRLLGSSAIILYVLTLSWDNYIYPQSHFFLTALFLVHIALIIAATQTRRPTAHIIIASLIALLLLLSNAVTGTAAVAITVVFYALAATRGAAPLRPWYLLGILAWVLLFITLPPGQASFGLPHFSYTGAFDMLRLAPPIGLLAIALLWRTGRYPVLRTASTLLMIMAYVTFLFSNRDIIVANAPRFFYHALLVAFPLLAFPATYLYSWGRLRLHDLRRLWPEGAVTAGLVLVILGFMLLPAALAVVEAHDNLQFKNVHRIALDEQVALAWLAEHASTDAVIAASPAEPWIVPLFTGRALLRTNYWLSPDDQLQQILNEAFTGNPEAQSIVAERSDYIYLRGDERERWSTLLWDIEPSFHLGTATIYETADL